MMLTKLFLFLAVIVSPSVVSWAQTMPPGTKHIEKIYATQYVKGDTLSHKVNITYYDSLWNSIEFHGGNGAKYNTIYQSPEREVQALVEANGDTSYTFIYLYDSKHNRTHNFQLDKKGDTLVGQKWIYDDRGNVLVLFNKEQKKSTYYLRLKAEYDQENEVTYRETYNAAGALIRTEQSKIAADGKTREFYQSDQSGNKVLRMKTIKMEPGTTKTLLFYNQELFNYGITLNYMIGGSIITKNNSQGKLISKEIYNDKNKRIVSIYAFYTDLE